MKRLFFALAVLLAFFFPFNVAPAAPQNENIVLIVPARPRLIALAFDLAKIRDLTIVSFRGKAADAEALVHVWTGREWEYVRFDDFCAMNFIKPAPRAAMVVGDDQVVPQGILKNMAWPCKTERLATLNIAELLNGLNAYFNFSSREWKRLAGRYDLRLEDLNAERRAYNPYDVPRSKMPLAADTQPDKNDTPPAVIEKSGAPKPAEKPWIK